MRDFRMLLVAVLAVLIFSHVSHAANTTGVFSPPFDEHQHWQDCGSTGFWDNPPDHGQDFMHLNTGNNKYHAAEDWNGKCGGSSDMGAVLYAIADGAVQGVDDATDTNSGFGKLLLIRHTLPDGTQRDVLYEHILNIEINPRTGAKFKQDDPVYRGDTIARLGDANGHIPADLVVDKKTSAVRGSSILDFPCTPCSLPRHFPENNISHINMLKIYH